MKTQMITVALLVCFLSSFGQRVFTQDLIDRRDSLIKRGKIERSGAFIPLSCGSAFLLGGIIAFSKMDGSLDDIDRGLGGTALVTVGVGIIGISIVQFIHANRKFERANQIGLEINKPVVINMGLNKWVLPYSVGISIPIN